MWTNASSNPPIKILTLIMTYDVALMLLLLTLKKYLPTGNKSRLIFKSLKLNLEVLEKGVKYVQS